MTELLAHVILACTVLIIYLVLELTGHDANPLIALLAGQGIGVGVTHATQNA